LEVGTEDRSGPDENDAFGKKSSGKPGAPGQSGATGSTRPGTANPTPNGGDPAALPDGAVETVPANCQSSGIAGNGQITRTTRSATGFTKVASEITGVVMIQEGGTTFHVQVEADSNLQSSIMIGVNGDTLDIGSEGSFCSHRLRVVVTMPLVRAVQGNGSGNIEIAKRSPASDVDLGLPGSGNLQFAGSARALHVSLAGAGSIRLTNGSAQSTAVDLTGSGNVTASGFVTGSVQKSITGSGNVDF
jgi:hypothetical protein